MCDINVERDDNLVGVRSFARPNQGRRVALIIVPAARSDVGASIHCDIEGFISHLGGSNACATLAILFRADRNSYVVSYCISTDGTGFPERWRAGAREDCLWARRGPENQRGRSLPRDSFR